MVSEYEMKILAEQLGRLPREVRAIERYCPLGHPQVIRVYPLIGEKPFPTLFWLTCPSLIQQISRLEYQGVIEIVERLVQVDVSFRARYHKDHRTYITERWAELSEDDRRWVEAKGLRLVFMERGIGGVRDWDTVKCLHMHYAHHQARENVIGRWLDDHYAIVECQAKS
ncbi:MAG: hypothetical protein A2Z21_01620 [Candidatus Fraserbacteria bacterium RBG_16_55_9]|uniref:DUF501 domain-containing protein n=1 Tax=Fraserbacteria sp. (strain RBG_16_55_9) TaxID=1817864 RepID=A0A1F5UX05_FRAXR|nr:MAG: hypothetical protein A2Z21_01620 [Candidatus Fraserbacteria bacterium RBG_16_55_9]